MTGDLNSNETCDVMSDIRSKFLLMSDQVQPAMVTMLDTLSASQLEVLARKFDKNNVTFLNDYLQPKKPASQTKRYKQAVNRAEMLYGRLDEKQLALLAQQIETSRFSGVLAYAERQRRQQDTLQTLRGLLQTQATAEQKRLAVRSLLERTVTSPNPNHAEYV